MLCKEFENYADVKLGILNVNLKFHIFNNFNITQKLLNRMKRYP